MIQGESEAAHPATTGARELAAALRGEATRESVGFARPLTFEQLLELLNDRDLMAVSCEVNLLFRDLMIGVTTFFRDAEAFAALDTDVIPKLLEAGNASESVRVWVPGCATGEEVYSIAILLREHTEGLGKAPKVQVFGTDIDEAALAVARAGRYPFSALEEVSPARRQRFFTGEAGTFQLAKELCIFSLHSLVRDPPFSRIDLISCRNLLIYLDSDLQSKIMPVFHYALRPGGFLFLGISENISQQNDLFAAIDKRYRVFRRRDHVATGPPLPLLLSSPRLLAAQIDHQTEALALGNSLRRTVDLRVLDRFTPAHVVVNREGDIVYYSPRTGKYLEAPSGQPSRQLLAMARKGLRLDLRAALREAVDTRRPATRERIARCCGVRWPR